MTASPDPSSSSSYENKGEGSGQPLEMSWSVNPFQPSSTTMSTSYSSSTNWAYYPPGTTTAWWGIYPPPQHYLVTSPYTVTPSPTAGQVRPTQPLTKESNQRYDGLLADYSMLGTTAEGDLLIVALHIPELEQMGLPTPTLQMNLKQAADFLLKMQGIVRAMAQQPLPGETPSSSSSCSYHPDSSDSDDDDPDDDAAA